MNSRIWKYILGVLAIVQRVIIDIFIEDKDIKGGKS